MNDKSISHFYSTLFEYNYQSNLKILDAIEKQPTAFPQKVFFLYSHIQNAHHIWNGRISGNLSTYNVFQIHPLEQLRQLNEENFHLSFKLIQTTELDKEILYSTSKGENFSNT
ncbi:MAG: hypothetical protein N2203_05830, partial [Bacteroidia bacterium]|nr:hypothetical protein [Bacteroidia bacterium]